MAGRGGGGMEMGLQEQAAAAGMRKGPTPSPPPPFFLVVRETPIHTLLHTRSNQLPPEGSDFSQISVVHTTSSQMDLLPGKENQCSFF